MAYRVVLAALGVLLVAALYPVIEGAVNMQTVTGVYVGNFTVFGGQVYPVTGWGRVYNVAGQTVIQYNGMALVANGTVIFGHLAQPRQYTGYVKGPAVIAGGIQIITGQHIKTGGYVYLYPGAEAYVVDALVWP
ncbi:hypothetical protein TTSV1_gp12 [Thermoproteus tenax spherical virus 1]|uniref:Uncharacterized protein n=1 Tax=Thermoproteus tenax spherical virus 1 TaxID=292639 RepID=Q647F0_9VIRU|nr:hypothetical protein TTSV1_gp12 [Thermoproteus tenax spherical virus 1]AAU25962.1 hypothetical protein [Thermoproteus tenax spherical virus 1]